MAFPLTPLQQEEITNYRNFLLSLRNAGITNPEENTATTTPPVIIDNDVIGVATPTPDTDRGLLANLLSAFGLESGQCSSGWCGWLSLLLLLIIAVLSYYLYKERQNNKKLEKINKEIDLK